MEKQKNAVVTRGYLSALITVFIWGVTFISTKILLRTYNPIEILFIRFVIGYVTLWAVYPKPIKKTTKQAEILFAFSGITGVSLYYLLENIALTYSTASNIGVILSISPFFTALCSFLFFKGKKISKQFLIGFIIAIVGIGLVSFNGSVALKLNPIGDFLAIGAAIVWAFYANLTSQIDNSQYHIIQTTRRVFFYGILFMIPALFFFNFSPDLFALLEPLNLVNILFLGLGASAMCFVTWNYALKTLGSVTASSFIYLVPVITVMMSVIILNEQITGMTVLGIMLTLCGLILSEKKPKSSHSSSLARNEGDKR